MIKNRVKSGSPGLCADSFRIQFGVHKRPGEQIGQFGDGLKEAVHVLNANLNISIELISEHTHLKFDPATSLTDSDDIEGEELPERLSSPEVKVTVWPVTAADLTAAKQYFPQYCSQLRLLCAVKGPKQSHPVEVYERLDRATNLLVFVNGFKFPPADIADKKKFHFAYNIRGIGTGITRGRSELPSSWKETIASHIKGGALHKHQAAIELLMKMLVKQDESYWEYSKAEFSDQVAIYLKRVNDETDGQRKKLEKIVQREEEDANEIEEKAKKERDLQLVQVALDLATDEPLARVDSAASSSHRQAAAAARAKLEQLPPTFVVQPISDPISTIPGLRIIPLSNTTLNKLGGKIPEVKGTNRQHLREQVEALSNHLERPVTVQVVPDLDQPARFLPGDAKLLISSDKKFDENTVLNAAVEELWSFYSAEAGPDKTAKDWLVKLTKVLPRRSVRPHGKSLPFLMVLGSYSISGHSTGSCEACRVPLHL